MSEASRLGGGNQFTRYSKPNRPYNAVDPNQPTPYYATSGSNDASLIILVDGEMPAQDSVKYAKILLWITRFKGADTYSINDGSSFASFGIVDSTYNLRQFMSSDLPNNGNVKIGYSDTAAIPYMGFFYYTSMYSALLLS